MGMEVWGLELGPRESALSNTCPKNNNSAENEMGPGKRRDRKLELLVQDLMSGNDLSGVGLRLPESMTGRGAIVPRYFAT
jgi:hypothetical protein